MNPHHATISEGGEALDVTHGWQRERSLLERSSLYREFLAEREEIMKLKWLESEKAGRDIGFESALVSWVVHHRTGWRKTRLTLVRRAELTAVLGPRVL
jgi:hypothetical protein